MITSIPSYVKLALIALLSITAMLITSQATHAAGTDDFVITVQSDILGNSSDTEYILPVDTSLTYDYNVDCDDDGVDEATAVTGAYTCDFNTSSSGTGAGTYTIRIEDNTGTNDGFPRIFPNYTPAPRDTNKLIDVAQWGTMNWTTFVFAFGDSANVNFSATDTPNLSNVTDMNSMFSRATNFNSDISAWDVSNVTDISNMFAIATSFNQPLNSWDVSSVVNMFNVFSGAAAFNQPLDNWDVGNVTVMNATFRGATSFAQDITGWDTSNVTTMERMFEWNTTFNMPLNDLDVSNVQNFTGMFHQADSFNQPLDSWDTSSANAMDIMFWRNDSFNQDVSSWDVSGVVDFEAMFAESVFNQPVGAWNVGSGQDFTGVFFLNPVFNQDVSSWDMSSALETNAMFAQATSFNQDVSSWDVSNVTEMGGMFADATSFDQDLSGWDITSVVFTPGTFLGYDRGLGNMFANATLSTPNYNNILVAWATQSVNSNIVFDAGNSQYCTDGHAARETLINTYTWTVTDGGPGECIDIFLDLSSSPADTTTTTPNATYTITFSEPIDPTTFTLADITLSGTTTASIDSLTEGAPNDGTTFELQISNLVLDEEVTIEIANSTTNNSVGVSNQAVLGTLTYTQDSDNDGIPDTEEQIAFNGGDANNDGTPDYLQPTVTTIMNEDGTHSTLQIDTCTQVAMYDNKQESELQQQNSFLDFPLGLTFFNLQCAVGDTATITLYFNTDQEITNFYKYDEDTAEVTLIDTATFTTQDIDGQTLQVVTYQITDGGTYDDDGEMNGAIVDPAGFGVQLAQADTADEPEELAETGEYAAMFIVAGTIFALTPIILGLVHRQLEEIGAGL